MSKQHHLDDYANAVVPAIPVTTTYYFSSTQDVIDYHMGVGSAARYARYDNRVWQHVEQQMAHLDGCDDAAVFPCGMSAISNTLMNLAQSGDHIVYMGKGYRNVSTLCSEVLPRFGISTSPVVCGMDDDVVEEIVAAVRPNTRVVFLEMPTNPQLFLTDISCLKKRLPEECRLVVDSTIATPINFKPNVYGADLVIHSLGKFITGHSNAMGGSVAGPIDLIQNIKKMRNVIGSICDSENMHRVLTGLQTLELRMNAVNKSAQLVAEWLESDPRVKRVYYTGLKSHPHADLAATMFSGHGGLITFELDGSIEQTATFVENVDVAYMSTGFGGVQTQIEQPRLFTYFRQSQAVCGAAGITGSMVRLSLGVDPTERIIESLSAALNTAFSTRKDGAYILERLSAVMPN